MSAAHWRKLGRVWGPDGSLPWAAHSCLTPTPVLMDDRIRVYAGFRDTLGVSRIGFVDVDPSDPTKVLRVGELPALDVGEPGCFDDNGVILGDVVHAGSALRMYYVGFQLVAKAKFLAFTGCAESRDGGETFQRLAKAPVMDRSDEGLYIRAIHTVRRAGAKWQAWYAAGDGWETMGGQSFPRYHIRYAESDDGTQFPDQGVVCLRGGPGEYRIGRPRVYPHTGGLVMFFTYGTTDGRYLPGAALSRDGISWQRDDTVCGLHPSTSGWDSRHLCYPSLVESGGRTLVFYNGNDMGKDGFGCAEIVDGN